MGEEKPSFEKTQPSFRANTTVIFTECNRLSEQKTPYI